MTAPATGRRIAVVEIGSRAVRLLVAEIGPGPSLRVVRTDSREARLAKALGAGGDELDRTVAALGETLRDVRARAAESGATQVEVFGTEAVRRLDAAHVDALRAAVPELDVLTPRAEAALSLIAGVMSTRDPARAGDAALVIDQGSASMEIVTARARTALAAPEPAEFGSYDLGTHELVRMLRDGGGDVRRLREAIDARLGDTIAAPDAGVPVVLGSAATKLAWLLLRHDPRALYDPRRVHGRTVRRAEIARLAAVAAADPVTARRAIDPRDPGGGEYEIVLAGLIAIDAVLERGARDAFVVSAQGTRHGLAWKRALEGYGGPYNENR